MRFAEFFAGIGGFRLGLERAGHECVWACEINPYARTVYERRFAPVPFQRDIHHVRPEEIVPADLWVGGFPCQDISSAGARSERRYLDGSRSGLWWSWYRLISAVRPPVLVVENVPGNLDRWLPELLGSLAEIRYHALWFPLSLSEFGAPDRRTRIVIVAYADGQRRATVAQSHSEAQAEEGLQGEHRGNSDRPMRWSAEPTSSRVADGVSRRMDRARLHAIGNSFSPIAAEWIGWRLWTVLPLKDDCDF